MSSQQVVYLSPEDAAGLAYVLASAVEQQSPVRLWVDDGGIKYSIARRTWSFPPMGSTVEP